MIYLVEDDSNIRELVEHTLCSLGLETKGFASPVEFEKAMKAIKPKSALLMVELLQ